MMSHKNNSRLTPCAKRKRRTQIAKLLTKTRQICREMPQENVKNSLSVSVVNEVDITFDNDVFDVVQNSKANKDELFEAEGRRIVDIIYLFVSLKTIKHSGFGCSVLDVEIIGERRLGLKSIFKYNCAMCELLGSFATEGENAPPNINEISASGAVPAGPEYSHFSELCFAFNIPSMSDKMYILAESKVL
ncbi:hypothetical protein ILUMI_16982 [Ignelater luminosus]|uniref:Mutator-like transposase domain-containing protein n=1 Tax=Ignelater luminosus TaxID=2038154 RepID=A0A8K0CP76_IGNLU|nr:hypothetical protein ILUMI_16982 [Ignelater luminosus]